MKSAMVLGRKTGFEKPVVGVLPVFNTMEEAKDYADGAEVFMIELDKTMEATA